MSSGTSGGGMSGDDPNDPNSPTYGGIAAPASRGDDADDPSSPNYGGMADLYAADAALQFDGTYPEVNELDDFAEQLRPAELQQPQTFMDKVVKEVEDKTLGDILYSAATAALPQPFGLFGMGLNALANAMYDPTRSGKGPVDGYYPNMMPRPDYTLGNKFGLGEKGAFPNNEMDYEFDPTYTRNVFTDRSRITDDQSEGGNQDPDPYARRRYLLPTPQTTAPVEPMVNNPLPLTPYDYQKQKWMGNQFILAPIRRT